MIYCISLRNYFLLNLDIATAVGSLFMLSEIYIKNAQKPVGIRFGWIFKKWGGSAVVW